MGPLSFFPFELPSQRAPRSPFLSPPRALGLTHPCHGVLQLTRAEVAVLLGEMGPEISKDKDTSRQEGTRKVMGRWFSEQRPGCRPGGLSIPGWALAEDRPRGQGQVGRLCMPRGWAWM